MEISKNNSDKQQNVVIRNEVYNYLRNTILEGEMKPGERIVERKIAQELQLSRTPVREAIQKLEQEGLIQQIPNRGAVVASLTPVDVWEIYNIRSVLEGLAVRLAAEHITPENLNTLEKILLAMEKALNENDYDELEKKHSEFHRTIVSSSRNQRLEEMINNLAKYVVTFTRIGYNAPGRRLEARDEHRQMYEALKKRSMDEAEQIARKHIEHSCKAYFLQRALSDSK